MKLSDVIGPRFWQGGELLMNAVSAGLNPDVRIVRKVCQNLDIDTGTVPEDLWDIGGLYTGFPPGTQTPEKFSIVSDSANDTAAGSGARTVRIFGLDSDWNELDETVTMNGTTPVLTTNTYRRFIRAQVISSGGSVANTNFNAGNITGTYETTTANVFFRMPAGFGATRDGNYTVPLGWSGLLVRIRVEIDRATTAACEGDIYYKPNGSSPRLIRPWTVSNSLNFIDTLIGGVPLVEKADIIPRCRIASANNVKMYASYQILLYRP